MTTMMTPGLPTPPRDFRTADRATTIAWLAAAVESFQTLGYANLEVETFARKAVRTSPHRDVIDLFRKAVCPKGIYESNRANGAFALSMTDDNEYWQAVYGRHA